MYTDNISSLEQVLEKQQPEHQYDLSERIHFVTSDEFDGVWYAASSDDERSILSEQYKEVLGPVIVSLYEDILDGTRKKFPDGTFKGEHGVLNSEVLVRSKVEKEGLTEDDMLNLPATYFSKQKLARAILTLNNSHVQALIAAFPELKLKPYYFRSVPQSYWKGRQGKKHAREATREFYSILNWSADEIIKKTTAETFDLNILPFGANLESMLSHVYGGSPIDAVIGAFPELNLKPHYFPVVPQSYWKGRKGKRHAKEATRELFERLGWDIEQIVNNTNQKVFLEGNMPFDSNLSGMLNAFNKSPIAVVINAYPEYNLKPHYFPLVTQSYWSGPEGKKHAREALREAFDILGIRPEELPQKASRRHSSDSRLPYAMNLNGMLSNVYKNSLTNAIIDAYPEMDFKPHYFSRVPRGYWFGPDGLRHAAEATREMVSILELPIDELPKLVSSRTFNQSILPYGGNLSSMFKHVFNRNLGLAIMNAYPGRFTQDQFSINLRN